MVAEIRIVARHGILERGATVLLVVVPARFVVAFLRLGEGEHGVCSVEGRESG
jgi:hypothetical protein